MVRLLIILYSVVLTVESVDEILNPFGSRHKLNKSKRTDQFKTSSVDLVAHLYNVIFLVVCSLAL